MKKGFIWFIIFVVVAVGGFFITSLCMASNNGNTLAEEWKSWFTAEETSEDESLQDEVIEDDVTEENTETQE